LGEEAKTEVKASLIHTSIGGFVGAYVVGWLQGGVGDGAAFAFMAAALSWHPSSCSW